MPVRVQPYLRLMRADRPVGFYLLMWPCFWSTALALPPTSPQFWQLLALFALGSIVMRGAGCTWNDIVDRDLDAGVDRTALRPIPAGDVTVRQALAFAVGLSLIGFLVLIALPPFAILLGTASLIPVALYPFAKRIIHYPQAVLGLTFNWGAMMGWAAVYQSLSLAPFLLYAGAWCWTMGYDTIYAHMDKADDAVIGVKSTALKFGDRSRPIIACFYAAFILLTAGAMALTLPDMVSTLGVLAAGAHLTWQVRAVDFDDPTSCLRAFKSNHVCGALIFAALVLGHFIA